MNTPKVYDKLLKDTEFSLYGISEGNQKTAQILNHIYDKSLSPKEAQVVNQFQDSVLERLKEFQAAIKPLTEERESATKQVIDSWQSFMMVSPISYTALIEYLDSQEFADSREDNRPFLQLLQRRANIIEATTRMSAERQITEPDPSTLSEFLKRNFILTAKDGTVRDWLLLLSYPDEEIGPDQIAGMITRAGILPRDIKQPYQNYLHNLIFPLAKRIQSLLEEYRIQRPTFSISHDTQFIRPIIDHKSKVPQTKIRMDRQGEMEKRERPTYKVMVVRRGEPVELTGEFRDRYVNDAADQFSGSDPIMRGDIQKIINSLQEDPWGLGVGKLTDFKTTSLDQKRSLTLRRYRADRRPGVSLGSSKAKVLRAVFYFDSKAYPDTLFLDEILHHADFDIKYT